MKPKKHSLRLIIIGFFVFALISFGLYLYNNYVRENLALQACNTLSEIMDQQMHNFDSKLTNDKDMMRAFADMFTEVPHDRETILGVLNKIIGDTGFEFMNFIALDGKSFNQQGMDFDVSDRDYFSRVMRGEAVISQPIQSKIMNVRIIAIVAPIIKNGEIKGALAGSYKAESLDKLFLPSFNGAGYAYITTNDGEIIAKSVNSYSLSIEAANLFEAWKDADFFFGDNLATIYKNLYEDKGGHSRYRFQGKTRFMHYGTIHVNTWNIFAIAPEEAISKDSDKVVSATAVLTFVVSMIFLLVLLYVFLSDRTFVKALTRMAFTDELTAADNLNKFKIDMQRILQNNPDSEYIVIKLDIDNFKLLNDMHGFTTGDKVLRNIAASLDMTLEHEDEAFARVGSDEFTLILRFISMEHLAKQRERFIANFHELMGTDFDYKMKFPTGQYLVQKGEDVTDTVAILEKANFAHRKAKEDKTAENIVNYDEKVKATVFREKDIENKMLAALENHEFKVYIQPKHRLDDETIGGAEALARWKPAGANMLYPSAFIPIFERNGFITKLDMYMFEEVCAALRRWIDEGLTNPPVISVNFSKLHLSNDDFVSDLCIIADKYNVPHHYLEVELTESTMAENENLLISIFDNLHRENFLLSLDDFGTGYSSLGMLKNLPVDTLKMDRSFFLAAHDNSRARVVLSNVIQMAKDLNIKTVAEGVEERTHIDMLKEMKCDMVQGYYYAKPMNISDFRKILKF